MTLQRIREVLARHGISSGRIIAHSKSTYCRRFPKHLVVFNAKVFTRRGLILRQVDLDMTKDGDLLTAAAREIDENFFVLHEGDPTPGWKPGSMPMRQVLRNAVWWTRIKPTDEDVFTPINSPSPLRRHRPLVYSTGHWLGRPAYSVNCWEIDEIYNCNMSGTAIEILGKPPQALVAGESDGREELSLPPAGKRGRPVRPMFYQTTGLLSYVWFNHGTAIPALLYDQVLRPLGRLSFTMHQDHGAIHMRRDGEVIGLVWPCSISAPEVWMNARRHLSRSAFKN